MFLAVCIPIVIVRKRRRRLRQLREDLTETSPINIQYQAPPAGTMVPVLQTPQQQYSNIGYGAINYSTTEEEEEEPDVMY